MRRIDPSYGLLFFALILGLGAAQAGEADAPVGPKAKNGWYSDAELDQAFADARLLGRPVVLLFTIPDSSCPLLTSQQDVWLREKGLAPFVRIIVDQAGESGEARATVKRWRDEWRATAVGEYGQHIPSLLMGTGTGEYCAMVQYKGTPKSMKDAIDKTMDAVGPQCDEKTALQLRKTHKKAKEDWAAGNTVRALDQFRQLRMSEKKKPKFPLFAEMKSDLEAIETRCSEEIARFLALLDEGKTEDARTLYEKVRWDFRQFPGADKAQEAWLTRTAKNK